MKSQAYAFAVLSKMKAICYAKVYHPNGAVAAALVLRRYRIVRDQNFEARSVWVFYVGALPRLQQRNSKAATV
jgi:hypothetical protein